MKLRPLLDAAIAAGTLTGNASPAAGSTGTPQRLAELIRNFGIENRMTHALSRPPQTPAETIGDGVAIVPTAPEGQPQPRRAPPLPLRQLFLVPDRLPRAGSGRRAGRRQGPKSILFCREKHEEREIWDGYRYGPKAAKAASASTPPLPDRATRQELPELLVDRDTLWHAIGHDADGMPASPRR